MTWLKTNWDRVVGWALVVVGVVFLVVGTVQVSRARLLADSLSYLMSAGLGGLGCLALGSALLVTAASHDEWQKLDAIERCLREELTPKAPEANGASNSQSIDLTSSSHTDWTARSDPPAGLRRRGA